MSIHGIHGVETIILEHCIYKLGHHGNNGTDNIVFNVCSILILMSTHFANNEPFLLLNKKYGSYESQTIGNEFGMFCCIIITQFHILTNNFNR